MILQKLQVKQFFLKKASYIELTEMQISKMRLSIYGVPGMLHKTVAAFAGGAPPRAKGSC